jgi:hypothetical protein
MDKDHSPDRLHQGQFHMLAEDRAALLDARAAALKAGLRLTPDHDPKWAPLEQALLGQQAPRMELCLWAAVGWLLHGGMVGSCD